MMLTYKSTYGVPVGLSGEPKAVPLRLSGKPGVFLDRGSTPTAPLEARRAVNSHWQRWLDATALRPDLERVRPDCDHEHQGAEHQEGPGSTSGLHVGTGMAVAGAASVLSIILTSRARARTGPPSASYASRRLPLAQTCAPLTHASGEPVR